MKRISLPIDDPFAGIAEKLNRSHENINNLETEIARFFKESKYPILCNDEGELLPEAIEYHSHLSIPPRISVLAGEIIHHLRSCLDHIIWHFSSDEYRRDSLRWIEFPILKSPPSPTYVFTQYERKVKGISDGRVLGLIKQLQPYNRSDHRSPLLLAIHQLDIVDKHRVLVIVSPIGAMEYPLEAMRKYWMDLSESPLGDAADLIAKFDVKGKPVPQVAFSDFAGRESEPVIQALTRMHNVTLDIVKEFSKFVPDH